MIGFPHGNSTTEVKVFEAGRAAEMGGQEIDMVVNIGKVLSGEWEYVKDEIAQINKTVVEKGAILKVIFENDCSLAFLLPLRGEILINFYTLDLSEEDITRLCNICNDVGVAYIKTSTGYGFVKQANGDYNYKGATYPHLELMRKHAKEGVQIKAAGGVRTLDDLLRVRSLGVSRVGATATAAILDEAIKRGIGSERKEVPVPVFP